MMRARLNVRCPVTLLLDGQQLQVLVAECAAWAAEGPVAQRLEVPIARGEAGHWVASFQMLAMKAHAALARGPRRDGRYRLEVSANQATRAYAALRWRLTAADAAWGPDAPVAVWRALAHGLAAPPQRPYGVQHEVAPPPPDLFGEPAHA